jgi:hypothetical protein
MTSAPWSAARDPLTLRAEVKSMADANDEEALVIDGGKTAHAG